MRVTNKEAERIATLRLIMAKGGTTYAAERANAYGQILRITARAAARTATTTPASVYARMGTAPVASTFTAWL